MRLVGMLRFRKKLYGGVEIERLNLTPELKKHRENLTM
jgi:hypothetical protein